MTDVLFGPTRWSDGPRWELGPAEPADGRAVLIAVAVGVAFDAGVRAGVSSVGGWLAVLVGAAGLVVSGRMHTTASHVCVGAASVLGGFLVLRTSPWLVPLDVLAVVALVVLAGMLARDGDIADLSVALLGSRVVAAVIHALGAASFLADPLLRRVRSSDTAAWQRLAWRVTTGALIAAPLVAVLALLLASADAIFASVLRVDVAVPSSALGHVILIVIGAVGIASVLRSASAIPPAPIAPLPWRLGGVEWTIVLGSVVALLGAFTTVQVIALTGGGRHVLETEGLTYATYARSGYFQLLAVTILTGLLLGATAALAERSTERDARRYVVLAELTVALTALVLLVALRRLWLYEDAYGWTMLRLMAKSGAVWLGVVLVLLAVRIAGVVRDRAWFVPAMAAAGLTVLVALNAMNPEAAVVRHNLQRAQAGHEFDPSYLAGLSADAVPALVGGLATLAPQDQAIVLRRLCERRVDDGGFLAWNRSASRARAAHRQVCG